MKLLEYTLQDLRVYDKCLIQTIPAIRNIRDF